MKTLKLWGWLLFGTALLLHGIGLFSGLYNRTGGLYGSSQAAMFLTILSLVCLLLSVTVSLIYHALGQRNR